jgi:hypothetical protein
VRSQPVEDQLRAFVGKQPVDGITPGSLHVVGLSMDLFVRRESIINEHKLS